MDRILQGCVVKCVKTDKTQNLSGLSSDVYNQFNSKLNNSPITLPSLLLTTRRNFLGGDTVVPCLWDVLHLDM